MSNIMLYVLRDTPKHRELLEDDLIEFGGKLAGAHKKGADYPERVFFERDIDDEGAEGLPFLLQLYMKTNIKQIG